MGDCLPDKWLLFERKTQIQILQSLSGINSNTVELSLPQSFAFYPIAFPEDALYGEERLLKALQVARQRDVVNLIHYISSEVARHAGGASQSDDITMLAVKIAKKDPAEQG